MKIRCDVLVVGAGVAGVPAAVAAARAGARTLLVERREFPGGACVAGLHQFICGLYLNGDPPSDQLLNRGLTAEICGLIADDRNAPRRAMRIGRVDVLPCSHGQFRDVLSGLIKREHSLESLFGTIVTSARFDGERIASVGSDVGEIVPGVVIDCSGDGVIIGCSPELHELRRERERQLAGCAVRFGGVRDLDGVVAVRVPYALKEAQDNGRLPHGLRFTVFSRGLEPGEGVCKLSLLPGALRGGLEVDEAVKAVHAILRESLAEFAGSVIVEASSEVLEREGPRLIGQYRLTAEDIMAGCRFPDGVAGNAWPMEIWDQSRGPTYRYLPAGRQYEIPLRCLKAAAAANLLCAGRCISVSPEALGSTRVMGPCMALGEAAGKEAARMAACCSSPCSRKHDANAICLSFTGTFRKSEPQIDE